MEKLKTWAANQRDFWSGQTVEWWGAHITVLWGLFIAFIMISRYSELKALSLNEMGDFFAGMFGPVAFAWLVLGYLQQGRELKLSSAALRMQAKELSDSVKQQTAMAEAQKLSLENHERTLEPLLVLTHLETVLDFNGYGNEFFRIDNTASYCESVRMEAVYKGVRQQASEFPILLSGDTHEFSLAPMPGNSEITITIYYTKISGLKSSQSFTVKKFTQEDGFRMFIQKHPFTRPS
ncbi:hypothetical protein NP572_05775 [Pseudomonas putida]|uniref:hypothetical protein n=1 Tax=Pseudomonas putida TaxID=303 RepID=UPI00236365ED|nr:hypothetical protein [Pseudomonas putida]MDD2035926.1 hypothetical protein [Pseudomonas putida]MDD2041647.1 hypothetical protein [Pseudomonas putida]